MARGTLIVIVLLAIFTTIVVGVNLGKSGSPDRSQQQKATVTGPTPKPTPIVHIYTDTTCAVELTYPEPILVTAIETGGAILTNVETKESYSLICQKSLPKPTGTTITKDTFSIASYSGTIYHNVPTKENTTVEKLMFHNTKKNLDISLSGSGETFGFIAQSLSVLP